MRIEEEIFLGYQLDKSKILDFGFKLIDGIYIKQYKIFNDEFTAEIKVHEKDVNGRIIDNAFDDEYTLFRNDKVVGEFVGKLREEYKSILLEIRDRCFIKVLFPDPQAVRIAKYIFDKYGDEPDFPWEKYPYFGIFRNKENNRWYGLIMNVEEDKLAKGASKRSVINIKPPADKFNELLKVDNIFPGWHMNKKSWVSVSLSDYFSDEYVEQLIDMSYQEVNGLSEVKVFPPKKKKQ